MKKIIWIFFVFVNNVNFTDDNTNVHAQMQRYQLGRHKHSYNYKAWNIKELSDYDLDEVSDIGLLFSNSSLVTEINLNYYKFYLIINHVLIHKFDNIENYKSFLKDIDTKIRSQWSYYNFLYNYFLYNKIIGMTYDDIITAIVDESRLFLDQNNEKDSNNRPCIIVVKDTEEKQKVVGFSVCNINNHEHVLDVEILAVKKELRRLGAAFSMLEFIENYAKKHDVDYIKIDVLSTNNGMINCVLKRGYNCVYRSENYDESDQPIALLHFEKKLV